MEASPEVLLVRNEMDEVGVDFMVDVHGELVQVVLCVCVCV